MDNEITAMVRATTAELLAGRMEVTPAGYYEITDAEIAMQGISTDELIKRGGVRNAKWRTWRMPMFMTERGL